MKLILPLLAGLVPAQELETLQFDIKDDLLAQAEKRSISVDKGGDLTSDNCNNGKFIFSQMPIKWSTKSVVWLLANTWTLLKLGDKANQQKLAVTTETESSELYTLKGNKLTVNANSKDRSMMGMVVCRYVIIAFIESFSHASLLLHSFSVMAKRLSICFKSLESQSLLVLQTHSPTWMAMQTKESTVKLAATPCPS